MEQKLKEEMKSCMKDFRLPRYHEIPNVGLYLEQVTKYISECLSPLSQDAITGSMISNYVKRGLIDNPVKKQYDREKIAYLIYISVVKTVLSMEDIKLMLKIQKSTYESHVAYDYFCTELENVMGSIFLRKNNLDSVSEDSPDEKVMLRNTIITVAHKIYLDKLFKTLSSQNEKQ